MSNSSEDDNFDAYREEMRSDNHSDREKSAEKPKVRRLKRGTDYNQRLKILNKALRGKLKDLNDRLERVLDKVYVKSLNPNKRTDNEPDVSHLIHVADKELENAKLQYDQCIVKKEKLEKEFQEHNDASAIIDVEDKLKQLTEVKKALTKEIVDLKFVSMSQGKQLERAEIDPEDPNEADNLLYKIKAIKKKREAMEIENEKHQSVMERLRQRIEEAKKKAENERKNVEAAERKQAELARNKPVDKNNYNTTKPEDDRHLDTSKDDHEYQKQNKMLLELKKDSKLKKFELEKLFIELHEKDKENRLLNLKVKELERIVPQNRLNPMSRDKSNGVTKRRRRMKNASINDANKSVLVTQKEQRLKQVRGRNKSPEQRDTSKKVTIDSKRQSNNGRLSKIHDNKIEKPAIDRRESLKDNDSDFDNRQHIKGAELDEPVYQQKQASERPQPLGRGLNGEPSVVKPQPELEKVNVPMKLNPKTFKTEVDIKK